MKTTNLDFDGMAGTGVNRARNPYAGNQSGLTARMNYGHRPGKGNDGSCDNPLKTSANPTKSPHVYPADTARGGKINGGAQRKFPARPDAINMGMK
jgi:hypothetical protein